MPLVQCKYCVVVVVVAIATQICRKKFAELQALQLPQLFLFLLFIYFIFSLLLNYQSVKRVDVAAQGNLTNNIDIINKKQTAAWQKKSKKKKQQQLSAQQMPDLEETFVKCHTRTRIRTHAHMHKQRQCSTFVQNRTIESNTEKQR